MTPGLGAMLLKDGFDGLLGGLLSSKTGPLKVATAGGITGVVQVSFGLLHPVCAALHRPNVITELG